MTAAVVKLRRAGPDDVKTVREILTAAATELTARFGHGHWSNARSAESLQKYAGNGELHVIEAGSVAVATLRLTERKIGFYRKGWFARPDDPAGYLMDMAVRPNQQRRGIGRRSMTLMEQFAHRAGLRAVRLDAYKGPAGAGGFYKKCGYVMVHESEFKGVALEYFEKLLAGKS